MQTLQEYKCPCCGGAIAFDSTLQKMKCPYCDTEFEMDALKGYDAELQGDQAEIFVRRRMDIGVNSRTKWNGRLRRDANGRRAKPPTCALMCASPAAARSSAMPIRLPHRVRSAAIPL